MRASKKELNILMSLNYDQARHSSIEMTNKYTPWNLDKANPELKKHDGKL